MNIEKLDGFTADGFGNVVGTQADLVDGDVMRIDGTIEQRYYAPVIIVPKPNNANNPYFGKKPLPTDEFYGLTGQVLAERYPRLRKDDAFLWVKDVIDNVQRVDPDDKSGRFLALLSYLATANATDGQKLMSAHDVAAIMAAWPTA